MATPFSRSVRSLAAERSGIKARLIAVVVMVIVLALWGAWAGLAEVTLWETGAGRVESIHRAHVVGASSSGRVVSVAAELGREVHSGEVLVELEADDVSAQLREAVVRREAFVAQIDAIEVEIEAAAALAESIARGSTFAVAEARAQRRRAGEEARWAREQASRLERLVASRSVADEIGGQAASEAAAWKSEARAAAFATKRVAGEADTREADAIVQLQGLRRERSRLIGQRDSAQAEIEGHTAERSRRRITAPVDGVVGERTELRPGSVVLEGQRVLTIVPRGPLRVVAKFPSRTTVGRLRPGQLARMRLEGFPWTRFGVVQLRVVRVGAEVQSGYLRVEFDIEKVPSEILLTHALQGTVEVAVERASPLEVMLRSVGQSFERSGNVEDVAPGRPVAATRGGVQRVGEP